MTAYQVWPTTPAGITNVTGANVALSTEFYVTAGGLSATEIRLYKPTGATGPWAVGLYRVDSTSAGTLLASGTVTDNGVGNAWQTLTLSSPVALTANQRYRVVGVFGTSGFPKIDNYWNTGQPGGSGITNGPLVAPGVAGATGSQQGAFAMSTVLVYPASAGSGAYIVDVTVADTPITGTGAVTAPAAQVAGTGTVTVAGTGAATSPPAAASGTGAVAVTGSGAMVAAPAVVAGMGTVAVAGSGQLVAPAPVIAGQGQVVVTGVGSVVAPAAVVSGYDALPQRAEDPRLTIHRNQAVVRIAPNLARGTLS